MQPLTLERIASEDFFTLLGLQHISAEEKEAMLEKMNETVQARVLLRILEQLSPAEQRQLDNQPTESFIEFLEQKGFNIPALYLEEALQYRLEIAQMFELATQPSADASV